MKKHHAIILISAFACLFSGCTSFKSIILKKDFDGDYSGNCLGQRVSGVPVKLKVPTHVQATIVESVAVDSKSGMPIMFDKRQLSIETETIYSDKIFMVDIPRPFAGTLDLSGTGDGFALTEDQYLTAIGAKYEDKTIQDITSIIGSDNFKKILGVQTSLSAPSDFNLHEQTRIVAIKRFDISESCWHETMNQWIEGFMSSCECDCSTKNSSQAMGAEHSVPKNELQAPISDRR